MTKKSVEDRLQHVEDMLEIYQLVSRYGPSVDSGSSAAAGELWTETGTYEVPGVGVFEGSKGVENMLEGSIHQTLMANGCAHVMAMPTVTIDGDTAVANGYCFLFTHNDAAFGVARLSATRWEMVRTGKGWRIQRRINELLDGREAPRELLARGLSAA